MPCQALTSSLLRGIPVLHARFGSLPRRGARPRARQALCSGALRRPDGRDKMMAVLCQTQRGARGTHRSQPVCPSFRPLPPWRWRSVAVAPRGGLAPQPPPPAARSATRHGPAWTPPESHYPYSLPSESLRVQSDLHLVLRLFTLLWLQLEAPFPTTMAMASHSGAQLHGRVVVMPSLQGAMPMPRGFGSIPGPVASSPPPPSQAGR